MFGWHFFSKEAPEKVISPLSFALIVLIGLVWKIAYPQDWPSIPNAVFLIGAVLAITWLVYTIFCSIQSGIAVMDHADLGGYSVLHSGSNRAGFFLDIGFRIFLVILLAYAAIIFFH